MPRKVVALLLNSAGLGHDYQAGLRQGVDRACHLNDLDLWVYAGQTSWLTAPSHVQVYRLMDPSRVTGIVVASALISSWSKLEDVLGLIRERCHVPTCSIGALCQGLPNFLIDNEGAAAKIVDHLVLVHGRRHFAFVGGPRHQVESEERLQGVCRALARHGLELRSDAIAYGDFSNSTGRTVASEFQRRGLKLDAIIAANDDSALGVLSYLIAVGVRCPTDVSVTGFDDTPSAALSPPPLTTIRQPLNRLGTEAVRSLMTMWDGNHFPELTRLETELVVRESCGCRATGLLTYHLRGDSTSPSATASTEALQLLRTLLNSEDQAKLWESRLMDAVDAERDRPQVGSLQHALEALIAQLPDNYLPIHELQRLLTCLRDRRHEGGKSEALEEAFHAARALIGWHAFRRAGELSLRNSHVLEDIRISWDALATSFGLPTLKQALIAELLRLDIRNAFIALYPQGEQSNLVPFVCIENGVPVELAVDPYPGKLLIPDGTFQRNRQYSMSVMPLTADPESIGVAVLELPQRADIYMLLREQISSAVKAVRLHEEMLVNARLQAQAQEEKRATVERLRSLSLIAGGVAHDLNNVLGPLVGLPEAIRRDMERLAPLPPEVADDLETIRRAAQRAAQTIGDLLSLGRPVPKHETTLDLNRLLTLEKTTFVALAGAEEQIQIRVEHGDQPLIVRASRLNLIRAISNLVLNAVDAIDGRGTVTVRAGLELLTERASGTEDVEPGEYAVLEVEDTGAGIPEAHMSQIFEPFFTSRHRATGSGSGTGLGLAIVRRIVKDSFGYVQVRSQLGHGTVFSLYFPVDAQVPSESEAPIAAVGGDERILVVDDEPVQLRTARRILEGIGYSVTTAHSGEEALELFASDPAAFDLIIVDMLMPGMDGLRTVERLRQIKPEQRALLASGYTPEQIDPARGAREVPRCLAKPYLWNELAAAVRATLDEPDERH